MADSTPEVWTALEHLLRVGVPARESAAPLDEEDVHPSFRGSGSVSNDPSNSTSDFEVNTHSLRYFDSAGTGTKMQQAPPSSESEHADDEMTDDETSRLREELRTKRQTFDERDMELVKASRALTDTADNWNEQFNRLKSIWIRLRDAWTSVESTRREFLETITRNGEQEGQSDGYWDNIREGEAKKHEVYLKRAKTLGLVGSVPPPGS